MIFKFEKLYIWSICKSGQKSEPQKQNKCKENKSAIKFE